MFIVDAKVKDLVYSGNTIIFILPSRECMRENSMQVCIILLDVITFYMKGNCL